MTYYDVIASSRERLELKLDAAYAGTRLSNGTTMLVENDIDLAWAQLWA